MFELLKLPTFCDVIEFSKFPWWRSK